jgi:copper transporter 1
MLISIIIIFFLALSYEKLRQFTVSFDKQIVDNGYPPVHSELINKCRSSNRQLVRALLYGGQIAFSFLLMLIFMTYNAYLMLAIVVGAATGFYMFHEENFAGRGMNCH